MPAKWGRGFLWWFQRLRELEASVTARDVLMTLAVHAGKPGGKNSGKAWPSIETIAASLDVSSRTVVKALGELKAAGIVKVTPRNRRLNQSNLYELAFEEPFQVNTMFTQSEPESDEHMVHLVAPGDEKAKPKQNESKSDADSDRSSEEIGSDHVNQKPENQFSNSCSNPSENRPIEPTNEPSVGYLPAALRAPERHDEKQKDDEERDQRDLERIIVALEPANLNGSAKGEARRLLTLCPDDSDRDNLVDSLGEVFDDPAFAEKTVTAKIALAYSRAVPF